MKFLLLLSGLILWESALCAGPGRLRLSLEEAEQRAVAASLDSRQAEAQLSVAKETLNIQKSSLKPRLSLEGSYRYLSEIPEAQLGPATVAFGQHHNYSVGPMLSYEVYNGGAHDKATEGIEHLLKAREKDQEATRLRTILDTRLAYSRVRLSLDEMRLLIGSLQVLQARLKDTQQRLRHGSASRLESLAIQREELQTKLRYMQTQASLAENLRKLAFLMGDRTLPEELLPIGPHDSPEALGLPAGNYIVDIDSAAGQMSRVKRTIGRQPSPTHPQLKAWDERKESARLEGESREQAGSPKIQVFAKSTYDYPHGPLDEAVWQNSFGVALSLTLYDGALRQHQKAQKLAELHSHEIQKEKIAQDFQESWANARAQLESLQLQRKVVQDAMARAEQEAQLTQANYQAGAINYLEVQRANTQVLEIRTSLSRLDAQVFAQYALLNYLSAQTEAAS
ncbi:TolC family protein [Oligoflexus tunisiensis]|uniref:TolC family protein n=1 Tax=Oligoflexus tunisiensis TaxID=708132 RepID=UPI00114CED29|nr:TolC family protein [Oligoflexus tunisiensis]